MFIDRGEENESGGYLISEYRGMYPCGFIWIAAGWGDTAANM